MLFIKVFNTNSEFTITVIGVLHQISCKCWTLRCTGVWCLKEQNNSMLLLMVLDGRGTVNDGSMKFDRNSLMKPQHCWTSVQGWYSNWKSHKIQTSICGYFLRIKAEMKNFSDTFLGGWQFWCTILKYRLRLWSPCLRKRCFVNSCNIKYERHVKFALPILDHVASDYLCFLSSKWSLAAEEKPPRA